ncbi:MAG TPA: lysophospholipid acyltransferase family protein [Pirellulaceae bacterium]|nr:lysophospholipid acyltransferase family protein [Pirellulaceae bacterium]HMO91885.1 lysophospholipid acyltransferase family protein [Pirellulaceae bacterium]HMP69705.1 lysophospholipid acyltransferase family protein [Pirellulaceae bacterium]
MKSRSRFWLHFRFGIEYLLVRVIVALIQVFPIEYCAVFAKGFGVFAYDKLRFRRKLINSNLRIVFPSAKQCEIDRIGRAMWEHLMLMVAEIAHAPRMLHEGTWRKHIQIRNKREISKYFLDGRPLILVSGHFGNFEIGCYMTGLLGLPTFAIAKPIGNPLIDRFIRKFRQSRGQYLLPYQNSTAIVERVLENRGLLSLLGDQHAGNRGCWIDFFGKQASCHKALALFTLTQQAPMLVIYSARVDRPMQFEVGCVGIAEPNALTDEQSTVKGLTQWYNKMLEGIVRAEPTQYWWVHNRWKEKPHRFRNVEPSATSPSAHANMSERAA